jgi:hypothetical protein
MSPASGASSGTRSRLPRLRADDLAGLVYALPALVVLGLAALWGADNGGFEATAWYPGALFLLVLLCLLVFDRGFSLRLREWRTVALVFFALFTAWSYLSIAWAGVKGDAWDAANQTLLYLTVYAILSRWRTSTRAAAVAVGAYAVPVAAIGMLTLERGLHGGHPETMFLAGRLASPIGYPNGEAAFFLIPLWPALYLVSRREVPALARGLLAASASLLFQAAVLVQSRGSLITFPLVAIIFFALGSSRARLMVTTGVVLGISAFNVGRLLNVYQVANGKGDFAGSLTAARNGMILPALAVFLLATAVALIERRLPVSPVVARRLDLGVVSVLGLAIVLAAGSGLYMTRDPFGRLDNAWQKFKVGTAASTPGSSHFTSIYGSHRYDFWRVSMQELGKHPLNGVGAGNFAVDYVRERHSSEEPSNPHSIEIRVLGQTGIVGAFLFLGFVASALVAARRRRAEGFGLGLAGALIAGFVYWLGHGSVDWLWEIPALGTVAIAFIALAAAVIAAEAPQSVPRRRAPVALAVLPLALVAALSYCAPWLSERDIAIASASWRTDPARAYRLLDQARSLDPLSADPDLTAGTIAARRHEYRRMAAAFRRALGRDRSSWYAELELGMAESKLGHRSEATTHLERARRLNPREVLIREVLHDLRAGKRVNIDAVNQGFLLRAEQFAVRI